MIIVGSSNTDMVVKAARLPAPGETVVGENLVVCHGGKGANQAVAAARLGAQVALVASLGDDGFGKESLAHYRREGIDVEYVRICPSIPSGVALIVVDEDGENQIAAAPGANAQLLSTDVESAGALYNFHDVTLLQLEVPLDAVVTAARLGREANHTIILNPAPPPSEPLPAELLKLVDILTPNETEAARLTGGASPEEAARMLRASGVEAVIVTLGKAGVLLAIGEATTLVPGFEVEAVDATGAGDAFNGGLAVAVERGFPLEEAVRYGQAVAALAVTKLGAQASLPTFEEVEVFLTAVPS